MMKKKISVRSRLVALMLVCWFLPIIFIAATTSYYLTNDRMKNEISKELQRLKFIDQSVTANLDQVIQSSREATYIDTLMTAYSDYRTGKISQKALVNDSCYFLRDYYGGNEQIKMSLCFYQENPRAMSCSAYNSRADGCYNCIKKYWQEDHSAVEAIAEQLDTGISFYQSKGNLYLIRNLYTHNYQKVATLVFLLNQHSLFEPYTALPEGAEVTIQIGDCTLPILGQPVTRKQVGFENEKKGSFGYTVDRVNLYEYHTSQRRDYPFTSLVRMPQSTVAALLSGYEHVFTVVVLCSVPMLLWLLCVYRRHVIVPIQHLMEGVQKIAAGDFGYQVAYEPSSREFAYVTDCFNSMSTQIDCQFEQIAKEEIALRDAQIKALQLHINPHFMNNTLEIINWEARLAGNEKISKMIEALGTLMNAGMNRKNKRLIPLSEEMTYVDAYLYIISERLGDRLTVINELPEDIMDYMVPRLILQPVVENAIEHGVVKTGSGTVILYGHRDREYLYLEILNESVLTEQDRKKMEKLLDVNYDSSQEPSGNLGISNVNQRLKMIYGEPCGLTITQVDKTHVCSRLMLRAAE